MVTIRIRSTVWFATGAVLALIVSLMVMDAWRADAAPGDSDATFVSMPSCRLVDTRPAPDRVGTNGAWGVADTKTLQATGTNGNCTIPAEAVGLSLKVFALNATAGGFLTIWADGVLPLGSALNPSPTGIVFSAVTTDLSATGSFKVYNENGMVDVIIDVNGYYTKTSLKEIDTRLKALEPPNMWAVVNADGTLVRGSTEVVSSDTTGGGGYEVIFNRDVTKCSYTATAGNAGGGIPLARFTSVASRDGTPNGMHVRLWDSGGVLKQDSAFHVIVACDAVTSGSLVVPSGTGSDQ